MDFVINGSAHGPISNELMKKGLLANGRIDLGASRPYLKTNAAGEVIGAFVNINGRERMVMNATLRKDEWVEYDKAVVATAKDRLVAVQLMQRYGLTYNLANGFGKTILETEKMSGMPDAEISMDGITRAKSSRVEFGIDYLPLPIVHEDFDINSRTLAASRTTGDPLDTIQVEEATIMVAEKIEDIFFNGASSYAFGSGTLYGLTDFPSRVTGSLSTNWDDMTASTYTIGEQIIADVIAMKQASLDAKHRGPWVLFVPGNYETTLEKDYVSGYAETIRERILRTENIKEVVISDKLSDDNVVLMQLTKNVARMVIGMPISTIEWMALGDMVHQFKVLGIMVPQFRADHSGNTGIIHYS